jgi:hypothetical protein
VALPLRLLILSTAFALLAAGAAGQALAAKSRWHQDQALDEAVDLAGPRADGRFVVARSGVSGGRLSLYEPGGALTGFARGPNGFANPSGEGYIAMAPQHRQPRGCNYGRDAVYAIDQSSTPGVTRIGRTGVVHRFAELPVGSGPGGIAFDRVGSFGHELLVGARVGLTQTIFAIDCNGKVSAVAKGSPPVEGGMAVAPRGFGKFAGELINVDEASSSVYATSPAGHTRLLAKTGTPSGGDIGAESVGFVPHAYRERRYTAYVASAHGGTNLGPGTKTILALGPSALRRAKLEPGDLLVANELAGTTVAIRCGDRCNVRRIATGPAAGHYEGHIVFARTP